MSSWTHVVLYPLGLVAFVMLLLYRLAGRKVKQSPALRSIFVVLACCTVISGLVLGYLEMKSRSSSRQKQGPESTTIHQLTSGDQSPAVAGIDGDVTITQSDKPKQNGTARGKK